MTLEIQALAWDLNLLPLDNWTSNDNAYYKQTKPAHILFHSKRHNNSLLHKQRQLIGFTLQIYYTTLYNYNHYNTNILYNIIQL